MEDTNSERNGLPTLIKQIYLVNYSVPVFDNTGWIDKTGHEHKGKITGDSVGKFYVLMVSDQEIESICKYNRIDKENITKITEVSLEDLVFAANVRTRTEVIARTAENESEADQKTKPYSDYTYEGTHTYNNR